MNRDKKFYFICMAERLVLLALLIVGIAFAVAALVMPSCGHSWRCGAGDDLRAAG